VALATGGARELDALEQEQEGGGGEGDVRRAFGRGLGEAKGAGLEPFSYQTKSVAVPEKERRDVPAPVDEDEQVAREQVEAEGRFGQGARAVEALARVDGLGGDVNRNAGR
jgi:hypothetical protein